MDVKGFMETSLVDWDGRIASLVFTPGCNLRCPYCYNHELVYEPGSYDNVPKESIFSFLDEHSDFIDGVVIVGGEPTVHSDLPDFCRALKERGMMVKLDTNGTRFGVLKALINENLVDYVAMDVKAPLEPEKYSRVAGVDMNGNLDGIVRSIELLKASGVDYEFRTTYVPTLMEPEDIEDIARELRGAKRYVLQKYAPLNIRVEELRGVAPPTDEEMDALVERARRYVEDVKWRGK
ncbi:MAG: anaerobic ribonucleoside-triphosphate reductase activating protein [Euryarchaeota archaeon]|nr:anaerobic ribonucleoside-triphosphate reductase activating protein [Euryarchaeota archaeon]